MTLRHQILFACIYLCLIFAVRSQTNPCDPTQIHLSFGDSYYSVSQPNTESSPLINDNQAYLVWHSADPTCSFTVTITDTETSESVSTITEFDVKDFTYDFAEAGDTTNTGVYTTVAYTALFKSLQYAKSYKYVIQDNNSETPAEPFEFILPTPHLKQTSRKILLSGDFDAFEEGIKTINAFKSLSETAYEEYGGWIMMGDASYNFEDEEGKRGDNYFEALQPFSSRWPLVMALGNHDDYADWAFANLRIRNPLFNLKQNHYFSFNYEGIHFTFLNFDVYDNADTTVQNEIYTWIEQDLITANTDQNRAKFPWLVFVTHRPIYCAYVEQGEDVASYPSTSWCYSFYAKRKIWDELIHKYSVDLALTAHKHSYERMGPLYQNQSAAFTSVPNDPLAHTIIDPEATVFIMEGSGGNNYYMPQPYDPVGFALTADVRASYGVFHVQNNTDNLTLVYEHYISETGEKFDYMNLVKTRTVAPVVIVEEEGVSVWTIVIIVVIILVIAAVAFINWKRKQQARLEELQDYSKNIPLIELKR